MLKAVDDLRKNLNPHKLLYNNISNMHVSNTNRERIENKHM